MVKAVRVHTVGGRHHLQLEDVQLPRPGCNEVEVRHTAIGLHHADVDACRGGQPHPAHSTFTPGLSAVGVITELGTGVLNHQIGQRVGYVTPPPAMGTFVEANVVPTKCLIPLPSSLPDEDAAALLIPGFTAWMLLKKVFPLQRGDPILIHGAAHGLGSLIAQWASHLRAFVVGTVDSVDDVETAEKNGCNGVVVAGPSSFADEVRELTGGEGVAAVFDPAVGNATFTGSLDCLAPKGMLVCLGAAGGEAPVLSLKDLGGRRSLFLACPVLADYVEVREDLLEGAQTLFELHKAGAVQVQVGKKFPLNGIKQAVEAVAKGEVLGSCILIPPVPDPKNAPHGS